MWESLEFLGYLGGAVSVSSDVKAKLERKYLDKKFIIKDELTSKLMKSDKGQIICVIDAQKVRVQLFNKDGAHIAVDGQYAIEMQVKDLEIIN